MDQQHKMSPEQVILIRLDERTKDLPATLAKFDDRISTLEKDRIRSTAVAAGWGAGFGAALALLARLGLEVGGK